MRERRTFSRWFLVVNTSLERGVDTPNLPAAPKYINTDKYISTEQLAQQTRKCLR